ncbi:MAG: 5'-3' exonuclease [Bacillaceae bacterium]|nr:5'-3' exonuclease [Bacillaceae bacterium]
MNNERPLASLNRLLIIDSMALLFRGFYATAVHGNLMQTRSGIYTNAVYQFTKYMLDAIRKFDPTYVACAFDMGKYTFRNEIYPDYKANRSDPPEELVPQFDLVKELVKSFDIPIFGVKGYEADDIMGTLASRFGSEDLDILLLTGDRDTFQLIDAHTSVIMMKKGFSNYELIHLDNFTDITGLKHPSQIIDYKGLMGDPSDHIPGCPGVGPKTALRLLNEFGNIDRLFEEIDRVKGNLKSKLLENKDLILTSRRLAEIRKDVDVACDIDSCLFQFTHERVLGKFEELEFNSLRKWIS